MIGLVRELTRASLFEAAWKPLIAFSCLARMKSSSVKALTMRMPCTVSASNSIICSAPWNSVAMMPRTRTPILRTPTAARGTNISARIDSTGSCRHHHDDQPDDGQRIARKSGDEDVEHAARRLRDERLAGDEFRGMRPAVIADLHPQHLVEDLPLDVGDDGVADPRHDNLLAVGGHALDRIDDHDRGRDLRQRRQVAADKDLIDDPPDDPGRERSRGRDHAHHREGEEIPFPVL